MFLTQKQCYKILETVYGKEEKILVSKVFKKVKDHMEWEKEVNPAFIRQNLFTKKNLNFRENKIGIYSFLTITLEDYHMTRKVY